MKKNILRLSGVRGLGGVRIWKPACVAALLFLLAGTLFSSEQQRPWQKFLSDNLANDSVKLNIPALNSFSLSNDSHKNLQVFYVEDSLLPRTTFKISIEGGQFQEDTALAGITSLWGELIVYSGSTRWPRQKLIEFFEQRGTQLSFRASLTKCEFTLTSLSHFALEDLEILFEILANPVFAKEDLELLRKQSVSALKKRLENPAQVALWLARKLLWQDTVKSVLTSEASLTSIHRENILQWHRQMLNKQAVYFQLSGSFEKPAWQSALNNLLETNKLFLQTELPFTTKPALSGHGLFEQLSNQVFVFHREVPQTTLLWKFQGIKHHDPDYFAYKIVNFILGGDSFNSVLMQKIRVENGWAYSAYSYYDANRYNGELDIFVQTKNENVLPVVQKVQEILSKPEEFLNLKSVEAAKQALQNKFVFLYENSEQLLAQQIGIKESELSDDYLQKYIENINQQKLDDIMRVAKKYFGPQNLSLFYVGPLKNSDVLLGVKQFKQIKVIDFLY